MDHKHIRAWCWHCSLSAHLRVWRRPRGRWAGCCAEPAAGRASIRNRRGNSSSGSRDTPASCGTGLRGSLCQLFSPGPSCQCSSGHVSVSEVFMSRGRVSGAEAGWTLTRDAAPVPPGLRRSQAWPSSGSGCLARPSLYKCIKCNGPPSSVPPPLIIWWNTGA